MFLFPGFPLEEEKALRSQGRNLSPEGGTVTFLNTRVFFFSVRYNRDSTALLFHVVSCEYIYIYIKIIR